ncbi:piggyBac transposable element-derived protein 4-like [Palaemon carinicauda]|uniref:piggyBac transposable element-derived protein 4-like n=1 Tax=Palaemon carinicauda TaxID=392227 RepID=UPI0035B65B56
MIEESIDGEESTDGEEEIQDESDSSTCSSENEDEFSSSDDENVLPSDWTRKGKSKLPFTFRGDSGVKFIIIDKENPMEYFAKFFDEEVIDYLVTKTNRYAGEFLDENGDRLSSQSRVNRWYDTDACEIKLFVGLLILQGIDSKLENSMYFTSRESIATLFYRKVMSGRRFDLLQKILHLVDNATIADGPGRKTAKIKPFTDLILKKFRENYIPRKNISIDESLMGWKGNLSWVQYIPAKRKRFGIKFFELCESSTGYIWNFCIYSGKNTTFLDKYKNLPVTSRVVMSLMDPLLGKGYCLYTDNFYTSPTLADMLVDNETETVGTLRLTRKDVPAFIKNAKLKKGETVAAFRNKSMVLKWKDKKDVCVLSTLHDDSMKIVKSRRGHEKSKPKAIEDYNNKMGGVDLSDNLMVHFSTARNRLKKYYKKVFRHMLDMCLLNAFITYKMLGGKFPRREFILRLAERMVSTYARRNKDAIRRPTRLVAKPSRLFERHFPEYCPPTEKKQKPLRKCALCRKNGKRKETSYWCKECNVGLCAAPCFKEWHTQE